MLNRVEDAANAPWIRGGGEMGKLVRAFDWSRTPLGALEAWPISLRTIVGTLLHSRHPMFLWAGPELIQFYNDAFVPSFGRGRHPSALGQRGEDCWQEVWPLIHPQIHDVMAHGKASWNQDQMVPIYRNSRIEEVYWTYGYSPVFDDAGMVSGTLVVCTETTARVVAERRREALRIFGLRTIAATTIEAVLDAVSEVLTGKPRDTPFGLLYFLDAAENPFLQRSIALSDGQRIALEAICRARLTSMGEGGTVDLSNEPVDFPSAPWPEPAAAAFIVRLHAGSSRVRGYLVVGLSPRLPFDDGYREHLLQFAEHVRAAFAHVETRDGEGRAPR